MQAASVALFFLSLGFLVACIVREAREEREERIAELIRKRDDER